MSDLWPAVLIGDDFYTQSLVTQTSDKVDNVQKLQDLDAYRTSLIERGFKPMGWYEYQHSEELKNDKPKRNPNAPLFSTLLWTSLGALAGAATPILFNARAGNNDVINGTLIGGGIGAVVGLLTANQAPEVTRNHMLNSYGRYLESVEKNGVAPETLKLGFAEREDARAAVKGSDVAR